MAGITLSTDIGQRMNFGNNVAKQLNEAPMITKEWEQSTGRQKKNADIENTAEKGLGYRACTDSSPREGESKALSVDFS